MQKTYRTDASSKNLFNMDSDRLLLLVISLVGVPGSTVSKDPGLPALVDTHIATMHKKAPAL